MLKKKKKNKNSCYDPKYEGIYKIWQRMMNRAGYKNHAKGYEDVNVCIAWRVFYVFQQWAFNNGYKPNLTLERIDPFGDYSPENCKFIPLSDQNKNRRNTLYVLENWGTGKQEETLKAYCNRTGINYYRARIRLTPILYKKTQNGGIEIKVRISDLV